jgi:hypothetical protein
MARLEALDGGGEDVVIGPARFVGGEVAADDQAGAQQVILRSRNAIGEFGVGR